MGPECVTMRGVSLIVLVLLVALPGIVEAKAPSEANRAP
jgi:hypothetical protein